MEVLAAAVLLGLLALVVFGVAVGVGILLGRRLDRVLEARAARETGAGEEVAGHE